MNSMGILHRDVKPSNILVNRSGEVKLCDFGESRISYSGLVSSFVGTIAYMAPELVDESAPKYDKRCDIWSLGITLSELILGKIPYDIQEHENENHVFLLSRKIKNTNAKAIVKKTFKNCQNDYERAKEFLGKCLEKCENRPDALELTKTDFYTTYSTMTPDDVRIKYM